MMRWFWLTLAAVVLVAVGATLVALPQAPEWTTSSRAALAEFEAGDEALSKVYFVEAREHFERAYEYDPEFLLAKWRFAQFLHDDNPQQATPILDDVMTADLANLTARERFLIEYWSAMRRNLPAEAARLVDECVVTYPDDPYILAVKASETWRYGNLEEAEHLYQRLLKIDPNWVVAYNALGYIKMTQGRFPEAEEHFKSYRFIAPDQANPHDSLGELFITTGRYDDAEASLETAIKIKPDFWASYIHLAILKTYIGDSDALRNLVESARAAGSPDGVVLEMECRARYVEMAGREAWREILAQRSGECAGGFRNGHAAIITHRAACLTHDWKTARKIEAEAAEHLSNARRIGDEDAVTALQAAVLQMEGVRLAIEGDYATAEKQLRAVDEQLGYMQVQFGMYKLFNRTILIETLFAGGNDAEGHQLLAEVRRINPSMVEEFEASGFRVLGLGRG